MNQIKNWLPGYLFYCGLLIHFVAILALVAIALKPSYRQELERAGQVALEPLESSNSCSEIFRGRPFDWDNTHAFNLPPGKADRYRVAPTYKSLGLMGKTADGFDLFKIAVNLELTNAKGFRAAVQPRGQVFFEVNGSDIIERCLVKVDSDESVTIDRRTHLEARWEPCERSGWFRQMECLDGGRHCRPTGFCQAGKGVAQ